MTEVAFAEALARWLHAGQVEASTGDPYVRHLERVVELLQRDELVLRQYLRPLWGADARSERALTNSSHAADVFAALHAVAWLHDVIEDTPVTLDVLQALGFQARVWRAVAILSRSPLARYDAYIDWIVQSADPIAIAVKIADLRDHLRPNCPPDMRPRYERALRRLEALVPDGAKERRW